MLKNRFPALVALVGATTGAASSFAALPDASAALAEITTSVTAYSTVMFAIAIASVGIMIGVKWIKRGRGAA